MKLSPAIKQSILTHAESVAHQECCGLILADDMDGLVCYYPCRNVADDPENYFEVDPEDYAEAESLGEILAVVHSHPNGEARLSIADRYMQDLLGLDFWLVCDGKLYFYPKIAPLVGRDFIHGKQDCYSIFRDFYFLAGADLPDFPRVDNWWEKGYNLYLANMAKHGFELVQDVSSLQVGDVILMQVGATIPNHAGIYIGNQTVLHHGPKRLSKRDLYDGYWLKHTHSIWRLNKWQRSQLDFSVTLNHLAKDLI